MATKILTLLAFSAAASAADPNVCEVTLTVKGPVTLIPEGITHEDAGKGTRKFTMNQNQDGLLVATGKVLSVPAPTEKIPAPVKVGEGQEGWYDWLLTYVPVAQGGKQAETPPATEPEAVKEPAKGKGKGKKSGKEAEPAPTPSPAEATAADAPAAGTKEARKLELENMPLGKVKEAYKAKYGKGVRPGVKTDAIIADVLAAEFPEGGGEFTPPAPAEKAAKAPKAPKEPKAPKTAPEGGAPGPGRPTKSTFPGFEDEKEVRVTYTHRDIGKCEYGAKFLADGTGFEITHIVGREDMAIGDKYRTAGDFCKKLMRKEKHHMSVARFFGLAEGTRS